jgi:hypothetical protein
VRSAAGAAFHETRLGEVLVGLRDRHMVDAELRGEPPNRRQACAGGQIARCDAIDDLLVQLQEERPAIALRQRNPERARLDRLPRMLLAIRHLTLLKTKLLYDFLYYCKQAGARKICTQHWRKFDALPCHRRLTDANRLTDIQTAL